MLLMLMLLRVEQSEAPDNGIDVHTELLPALALIPLFGVLVPLQEKRAPILSLGPSVLLGYSCVYRREEGRSGGLDSAVRKALASPRKSSKRP